MNVCQRKAFYRFFSIIVSGVLLFGIVKTIEAVELVRPEAPTPAFSVTTEATATGLPTPTMAAFDDQGRLIIAKTGSLLSDEPVIVRIEHDKTRTGLVRRSVFGDDLPIRSIAYHDGTLYIAHGSSFSTLCADGMVKTILTDLQGRNGDTWRPAGIAFGNDNILYIADWGSNAVAATQDGRLTGDGVLWKISAASALKTDVPTAVAPPAEHSPFVSIGVTSALLLFGVSLIRRNYPQSAENMLMLTTQERR